MNESKALNENFQKKGLEFFKRSCGISFVYKIIKFSNDTVDIYFFVTVPVQKILVVVVGDSQPDI